jgi:hypothetical protein
VAAASIGGRWKLLQGEILLRELCGGRVFVEDNAVKGDAAEREHL